MFRYIAAPEGTPADRRPHLPGIPARDISSKEAEDCGWTETLEASPAYETDKAPKAGKKGADE